MNAIVPENCLRHRLALRRPHSTHRILIYVCVQHIQIQMLPSDAHRTQTRRFVGHHHFLIEAILLLTSLLCIHEHIRVDLSIIHKRTLIWRVHEYELLLCMVAVACCVFALCMCVWWAVCIDENDIIHVFLLSVVFHFNTNLLLFIGLRNCWLAFRARHRRWFYAHENNYIMIFITSARLKLDVSVVLFVLNAWLEYGA